MSSNKEMNYQKLLLTGIVGFIGAFLVGVGEFSLQFSPLGGYEAEGYVFFARVSETRLTYGHFFSVLAAPLYLIGYWHLGQMFVQGGSVKSGWFITLFGGYAFVVGTAWLGGRVYLAYTAHAIANSASPESTQVLTELLGVFGEHNEPLVNALRLAMLIVSVLWIFLIAQGKTLYPRWIAVFSPIALLATIFIIYFYISPKLGAWLLPAAMNLVHMILFALSIFVVRKLQKEAA